MSWNLTKKFKETHLGPLKNSLGRSTSTSTIKADSVEPMEEKLNTSSSNDIGEGYDPLGFSCAYCR